MAVCVQNKKTKKIIRVSKAEAKKLFASGEYDYTSKSDWQRQQDPELESSGDK